MVSCWSSESFFLTAGHLNGLSPFGGPLHLVLPAAPHHPHPAFSFCLLGSTRLPASSSWFSGSSRTIGWDFTKAYVLKDACVLAKNNQACTHLTSAPLTCRQQESSSVFDIFHILTWEVKYCWVCIPGCCSAIFLHVCNTTSRSFHYSSIFRKEISVEGRHLRKRSIYM